MAYIFQRNNSRFWWIGYLDGGRTIRKSLKVTAKKTAELLMAEYQLREAKLLHRSTSLIIRKNIDEAFDEYIQNCAARSRTKIWYKNAKRWFLEFCNRQKLRFVSELHQDTLERFYAERKSTRPGGAKANIRAIRAVLNYAVKKGYLHESPAKGLKTEKTTRKFFRDLSFIEIEKILATAKEHSRAFYPFFATAYYVGLRESELIYLEPRDVDFTANPVHVRSKPENLIKDHQERVIPLNSKLKTILMELNPKGKWLFETVSGMPRKNNVNRELKRIGKASGVDTKGLCVQVLRETFGSHLRRRKVDIALISQYLGHSSIDVTLRHYAHIPLEETHTEIDLL